MYQIVHDIVFKLIPHSRCGIWTIITRSLSVLEKNMPRFRMSTPSRPSSSLEGFIVIVTRNEGGCLRDASICAPNSLKLQQPGELATIVHHCMMQLHSCTIRLVWSRSTIYSSIMRNWGYDVLNIGDTTCQKLLKQRTTLLRIVVRIQPTFPMMCTDKISHPFLFFIRIQRRTIYLSGLEEYGKIEQLFFLAVEEKCRTFKILFDFHRRVGGLVVALNWLHLLLHSPGNELKTFRSGRWRIEHIEKAPITSFSP